MTGSGRPLRVLWLIKGLGPGGAEQLLVNQAAAAGEGVSYEAAYVVPWKDHLVPLLEARGVVVHRLGTAEGDGGHRWPLRLRELLARRRFDVVHTHSPLLAAAARLVRPTLPPDRRPALVSTEHNRWPRHRWPTRLANLVTFPLDDAHLAVSADVRATIPRPLAGQVEVLVHGIDLATTRGRADRDRMRAALGIGAHEVVVGTVANLRREKNYELLLRAAARALAETSPTAAPLRFVSVGQGPLQAEVADLHGALGLGDRFLLLGYRADAVEVMSAFDVFTLASLHEGLPVALMDALALGLPVVATAVGGVPEAVRDGVEGLLVPSGDERGLAAAWRALADDPARRGAMGECAARAAAPYDARVATARLEDLYRSVAPAPRGAAPSDA